jgi:indoleamine 2,3-dioxygenase
MFKVKEIHYILRHGDRTPITPIGKEEFWQAQVATKESTDLGYQVVVERGQVKDSHVMAGVGPYGKLSKLGITEVEQRGRQLRCSIEEAGGVLLERNVSVRSTNFDRTVNSAQGFLKGLGVSQKNVRIDARRWKSFIPDSDMDQFHGLVKKYKARLEPYSKASGGKELRARVARKLNEAGLFPFGDAGPDGKDEPGGLSVDRLCEILCCLKAYNLMPATLTQEEIDAVTSIKNKWAFAFSGIGEFLEASMAPFLYAIVNSMRKLVWERKRAGIIKESGLKLNVYSAHDSCIYSTISAFLLRPLGLSPEEDGAMEWTTRMWPTYADSLRIDILERVEESEASAALRSGCPIVKMGKDEAERLGDGIFCVRFLFDGHGKVSVLGQPSEFVPVRAVRLNWEPEQISERLHPLLHEIGKHREACSDIFQQHSIDEVKGFLGLPGNGDPLDRLPNPLYEPWESLASNVPTLLKSSGFRAKARLLPVIDFKPLCKSKAELRRAYLVLSVLSSAYMWCDEGEMVVSVPPAISIPLCSVAEELDIAPVLIHASICLYNYKRLSRTGEISATNLDTVIDFLGSKDEKWFFLLTAEVEMHGARGLMPCLMLRMALKTIAKEHAASGRINSFWVPHVLGLLDKIESSIDKMTETISRMSDGCDPGAFYNFVRPFLAGTAGNPAMPNGVIYEGYEKYSGPQKFNGGSAAQSTIFPVLDAALDVAHNNPVSEGFLKEMQRFYMPKEHREFVLYLRDYGKEGVMLSIEDLVTNVLDGHERRAVSQRYNRCLDSLANFRSGHINLVARYIIVPQKKAAKGQAGSGESKPAKKRKLSENAGGKGTGGTGLMAFLKPIRDSTQSKKVGE